ncbi:protease modulator HflC [Metallumcola ferriviriculae]|uniref:Protein HflC n=1 Tax=Metallumcola ferriviriculae TaxID=3039180 RepID=A0AAU0UR20_9FIRM|nr:protease modulator HflC [Desulfitibacteraceae bacterium MK1]
MKNKSIPVLVLLVLAIVISSQSVFVINETDQAIITQFGDYIRTVDEPGLNFKIPFIQVIHKLDKRVLASDAQAAEYLTRDKKRISMDHVTRWKIIDPYVFYRTVRAETQARSRLDDIIFGRLRQEVAKHNFVELIREERETIIKTVTEEAMESANSLGIEVVDVRIKRVDLPGEVQESVFARMEAERNRIASRYRAEGEEKALEIRANADREREIILAEANRKSEVLRGQGDADATAIYAGAFEQDAEFYAFLRSLETYKKVLPEDTTMLLGIESELFKYFQSSSDR